MCTKKIESSVDAAAAKNKEPSLAARYITAGITGAVFSVWGKLTFVPESQTPGVDVPVHSYHNVLYLTVGYLISLPVLKFVVDSYLSKIWDMKLLLKESMILYNVAQVALNGWMVWRFVDAVFNKGHPFIGDVYTVHTGTVYAVWVHYCDKYLEFFDTYFMVLRGRMDQVSFLHVYHHFSIAWAWWIALTLYPGGDSYFGALFNSWIHVLMYAYYALSLCKIPCPWKRYLTQAQLFQFTSVVVYTLCMPFVSKEKLETKHYICMYVQIWEMMSLFVLFSMFYRKSYGKKKAASKALSSDGNNKASDDIDDQCQMAVAAASDAVGSAAKDAGKIASTANKVIQDVTKPAQKAMNQPSWSMTG
jgi:elongation of very long chain fatty acids protein 4